MNVPAPAPAIDQHHSDPAEHSRPDTAAEAIRLPIKITKVKVMYPHAGANEKSNNTIDDMYKKYLQLAFLHHGYARCLQVPLGFIS